MHSRIALSSIPTLTFYKDSITLSRRTNPIQQLVCVGKPCTLYTPDVVRCENVGGIDDQVDWKVRGVKYKSHIDHKTYWILLPSARLIFRTLYALEGWRYLAKVGAGLETHTF